jgi:hypothetical protein
MNTIDREHDIFNLSYSIISQTNMGSGDCYLEGYYLICNLTNQSGRKEVLLNISDGLLDNISVLGINVIPYEWLFNESILMYYFNSDVFNVTGDIYSGYRNVYSGNVTPNNYTISLVVSDGYLNVSRNITVVLTGMNCSSDLECDNGVFCDGIDICVNGGCQIVQINCSINDIDINRCDFIPDNNSDTIDYYKYESVCDELNDKCSSAPDYWNLEMMHWCDKSCGAECENQNDCVELFGNESNGSNNYKCVDCKCEKIANCSTDLECDNGVFCDGQEICSLGECISLNNANCSENDFNVKSCDYVPDGMNFTVDYYNFVSKCDVQLDSCTEKPVFWENMIMHWCDDSCGAECENDLDCDDGNNLTVDSCLGCFCQNIAEECTVNNDCSDGLFCNGVEICNEGICESGFDVECGIYDDVCAVGVCDESLDECVANTVLKDGNSCDDLDGCTNNDVCSNGICGGMVLDCGVNSIDILSCNNVPDGNSMTLDYYNFESTCVSEIDGGDGKCSSPPFYWQNMILHWCDDSCGAQCENDNDCNCGESIGSCVGCECIC